MHITVPLVITSKTRLWW